jgi:hypothetical protein
MKKVRIKAKMVIIGKSEAGDFIYQDTGRVVEDGDMAYMVINENVIDGTTEKLFFSNEDKANQAA